MSAVNVLPARVPATLARAEERRAFALDALAFLVPCLLFLEVHVGGRLFVSELLLLAALPFLLHRRAQLRTARFPAIVVVLGLLWLWGQVVTDLVRLTPYEDYSRGWMKIVFTLVNFVALFLIVEERRRAIRAFAAGMVVGLLLTFFLNPNVYAGSDPWKFGVALPVTLAIALAVSHPRIYAVPPLPALALATAAALNLSLGFRSLGGVCFLAAVCLALQSFGRRSALPVHFTPLRVAAVAALGVVLTVAFVQAYTHAARTGLLGPSATQKYWYLESRGLGILGGRPEIYVSVHAIKDSPLLGHGSWAKDPEYAGLLASRFPGFQPSSEIAKLGLIPTHSHLFGAWVEAGVLGAVFWLWVLLLAGRVLTRLYRVAEPLSPLIAFVALLVVWDVLFSPYGAERRLFVPYFLIVLLFAWNRLRRSTAE